MAAYSFSRFRFKGRFVLLFTILATRLLPPIAAVIPMFLLMSNLRLIDTQLVLIIIYCALNIPFAIWMMKTFFDGISVDLEEAAKIDGCSWFRTLYSITIPLAAPGMAATSIFVYVLAWNEFMFALIFTRTQAVTMPIVIAQTMGELGIYWQDMAVLVIIVMFPVFLFGFWMQKYLVRGLTVGALK
jgi:multiple sugar transport system permease protein